MTFDNNGFFELGGVYGHQKAAVCITLASEKGASNEQGSCSKTSDPHRVQYPVARWAFCYGTLMGRP